MSSPRFAAYAHLAIGSALCLGVCGVARAQTTTKTFIDYFRPTPVTCPLTTTAWGCTATGSTPPNCSVGMGVVPRDTCNGIESPTNPPGYYYWDGSILLAPDGTYHLFADRWAGSGGFNPGWESSDPIHAVGGGNPLGPYTDKGYAYSDGSFGGDSHHGHNSEVVTLLNGTYGLIVSEVVPFTVFTASSLDGPWTPCSGSPGAGLSVPAGFGGNTSYASNVSLVVRPDGNFEIVQRHGLIALSTSGICGPYKAQQPTNVYPSSETIPAQYSASIYPNRKKHLDSMAPSTVEATYIVAEDPVIWFSGGQYHVLYDYPGDRVGYHLTSTDGIHNWTDQGLAYDPRYAQQIFSYTDGTVDHWFKMERPGVLVENGHVTHVTFAVSDVDKNNQISAGTDHGSKVIVVPFDGVAFDSDMGVGGAGGAGGGGGMGGRSGTAGAGGKSGTGGAGGNGGVSAGAGGHSAGTGGSVAGASGGAVGSGGVGTGGATSGSGGITGTGAAPTGSGGHGTGGRASGSGGDGSGGNGTGGQGASGSGGSTPPPTNQDGGSSGCSCTTQGSAPTSAGGWAFALGIIVFCLVRRRRCPKRIPKLARSASGSAACAAANARVRAATR